MSLGTSSLNRKSKVIEFVVNAGVNITTNNFYIPGKSKKDGNIKENMQYNKIYTKNKKVACVSFGNRTDKNDYRRKLNHNILKTDDYGAKQKHKSVTVRSILSTALTGD